MDPLTKKYIEVLNEKTDSGVVKTTIKTGHSFEGTEKMNKTERSDENVSDEIETPEEDSRNSCGEKDGEMKKAPNYESSNPFEELYNKILQEDAFGWEIENENDSDSEDNMDSEVPSLEDADNDEDMEEDNSGEVTFTLDRETAQKLHDVLMSVLQDSEETEESDEDDTDEEEDDFEFDVSDEEDETVKEEVDAEVVGHALVDQEKLLKGMNKPSNNLVRGTIKAHKKKANVPTTGKGYKGELTKQKESAGKSLQNKNNKVPAVNVGKGIIDNK
jgi:hypothetical protein